MQKFLTVLLVLAIAGLLAPRTALAQTGAQAERIGAAYVIVLGRTPTASEMAHWEQQGRKSLTELISGLKQGVDADGQQAIARQACADAFGREPAAGEGSSAGNLTYTALMEQHVRWLAGNPPEYAAVVARAYRAVLQREPYSLETDYWRARSPVPFALLAACIENWARRNAPGLMVTTGTATVSVHSVWLQTVGLSPVVAAEVRSATGLLPAGDADLAAEIGRNVIAAGAGELVSNGAIHFVAAGAGR